MKFKVSLVNCKTRQAIGLSSVYGIEDVINGLPSAESLLVRANLFAQTETIGVVEYPSATPGHVWQVQRLPEMSIATIASDLPRQTAPVHWLVDRFDDGTYVGGIPVPFSWRNVRTALAIVLGIVLYALGCGISRV